MFLKRLEVQGFKSFADKIEMHYESGITGVVGPNGSGKSNISDSIRWVLGEQSPKSLRGSKMEDIIFAGTANRKPLGMAEVSLTFDNSDHSLPIDFGEVTITRRVYRSGESEYFLNKSSCRLKDIRELLMDTGIGREGYSIIGQGKIDEILNSRPEERRLIFEEAAGIIKYKTRRDEAEKKLSTTEDNLLRVADILHELGGQLEPLRRQANKAKEFKELKEKLLTLEVNLFIREIDKIDGELKHLLEQINMLTLSIEEQDRYKAQHTGQLETLEAQMKALEQKYSQLQEAFYHTENEIREWEGNISLTEEKIAHHTANIDRIKGDIHQLDQQDEELLKTLEEKQGELAGVDQELKALLEQLEEKLQIYQAAGAGLGAEEQSLETSKGTVIETLNEISDKKSNLNGLRTLIRTMEERIGQILREQEAQQEKIHEREERLAQLQREMAILEAQISESDVSLNQLQEQARLLELERQKREGELERHHQGLQRMVARKNLLEELEREHEGFSKSVKGILNACERDPRLGKGVHGVVANLVRVPKGYEVAIETALGPGIQNIVTDDENDGKRLIDYMKKHNLGRITVLPISALQPRELTPEEQEIIKEFPQVKGAFDLIEVDPPFQSVFSNLLSRVLVAPDLDTGIALARRLKHRVKIVTIDGDQLNIGGSMTGGSLQKSSGGILGRKRELEELSEEIIHLETQEKELQNLLQGLLHKGQSIQEELKQLNARYQEQRIQQATLKQSFTQGGEELKQLQRTLEQLQREHRQLEEVKADSYGKLMAEEETIAALEKKIQGIQEEIQDAQQELIKRRSQLEALNDEITQNKVTIASVEGNKKTLQQEIDHQRTILKRNQTQRERCLQQILETEGALKELNAQKTNLIGQLKELKDKAVQQQEDLAAAKEERNQVIAAENEVKSLLSNCEGVIAELKESSHRLELKRTRLEMQQQGFYNRLWEEYELTYQGALAYHEEIKDLSQVNGKIKEYREAIKALGDVNLGAIEEYERVKERHGFLKQQQEDLLQAKEALTEVIQDMERTMEKQFLEQFKIIRENFSNVFAKLFGGGRADLILEGQDNPLTSGVEIVAQPPGKKLQNLSLLSGGERALTAISLLFAILQAKPSPFCILDEIEAALDDANVKRFGSYLKALSAETQFIVVTHRKGTMEIADVLYGVTMEEEGVSKLVSVKLSDNNEVIAS